MYPGLVYGFVHFLRATDAADSTLSANDILLNKDGDVLSSVKDYARILEGIAGRTLVRNEYSRYESVALALLRVNTVKGQSPLHNEFPGAQSPLSLDAFFAALYRVYDLRFAYTYTDPGVRHLARVAWHPDSAALVALHNREAVTEFAEYRVRVSGT